MVICFGLVTFLSVDRCFVWIEFSDEIVKIKEKNEYQSHGSI